MNDCQKIQEMISAMLDGELLAKEREAIEEHIAACHKCAAMYADFTALSGVFEESREEVPANLHTKIFQHLYDTLFIGILLVHVINQRIDNQI